MFERRRQPLLPPLGGNTPRWGTWWTHWLGRTGMRLCRWRLTGTVPDVPRLVVIAAPHTCTLDVLIGIAVMLASGIRVRWFGKHTIFWEPLGSVLRWIGGIPVNRTAPCGLVEQAVALFGAEDRLFLALAPEGTRKKVQHWKTGFYRIAGAARVPIVPVSLDYQRRVSEIGQPLVPTGDYEADLAHLKRHFRAEMARHPDRY